MVKLARKKILLGIGGGIAAYKSAMLVRLLVAQGAEVRVVMTKGGQAFIQPLTLQALSGHPVHCELLDPEAEAGMGHIELSRWPDLILLAPATANLLARLAAGMADELLTTLVLAAKVPVWLAPAMNQQMWQAAVTQRNLHSLTQLNPHWQFLGPDSGSQACGEVGPGRMLEPQAMVEAMIAALTAEAWQPLAGKKILLTAGPTQEPLDPVRFLSNHSSGKMGYALAEQCQALGADVVLISGPVELACPAGVQRIRVQTAREMLAAVEQHLPQCFAFFAAAAVADFYLPEVAKHKLKKAEQQLDSLTLNLLPNPDILATVAGHQQRPSWVIGFAAETDNLLPHARAKRVRKGADLILANQVGMFDSGMKAENNAITLIADDHEHSFAMQDKTSLAKEVMTYLCQQIFRN